MPRALQPSRFLRALAACAMAGGFAAAAPQPATAAPGSADASASAWDRVRAAAPAPAPGLVTTLRPKRFAAFDLAGASLRATLADAPAEGSRAARSAPLVVSLPSPDGSFERFRVVDSPVMEPGLAARHPEIRTYAGRGIDDPTAGVRFDLTPLGVHAAVRGAGRDWFIDPRYTNDDTRHVSYFRSDLEDPREVPFVERELAATAAELPPPAARAPGEAVPLREYRLALLNDPTYAEEFASTTGGTTAAKVVLMNRVNQLYGTDLAVKMVLIDGNDTLNLNTAAAATGVDGPCGSDPCFVAAQLAECSTALLDRMGLVLGQLVTARNYDIGHIVLGKAGGGLAALGAVGTPNKAEGCSSTPQPFGDALAVDYVAHEMGHQFAGNHTFNGTQGECNVTNRNGPSLLEPGTAVEPGSGSSVMAYAGICGQDNLQAHSDPYFSQRSMAEIDGFTSATLDPVDAVQRISLRRFSKTESFVLTYSGVDTGRITRGPGGNYDAAGVKIALEAVTGLDTVSVSAYYPTRPLGPVLDDRGFTVSFGGTLSGSEVPLLGVTSFTGDAAGFVGEEVQGGQPLNGGTVVGPLNQSPSVVAIAPSFTIPVQTPFELSATASDDGSAPLTYLWEQNDGGGATGTALISNQKADGPLFRTFGTEARSLGDNKATTDGRRSFPDLGQILAGNTNAAAGTCAVDAAAAVTDAEQECFSEFLPTPAYGPAALNFRVTVRDNAPGAGGTGYADVALTLDKTARPFRLATPDAFAVEGGELPVAWDPSSTRAEPVRAENVRILLSTDDGASFSELVATTTNDGTENVILPRGSATGAARLRVEAVGNIFYDASREPFEIAPFGTPPPIEPVAPPADTTPTTTGTTPAPPPPFTFPPVVPTPDPAVAPEVAAARLARRALGATPLLIGTVGSVRLYAATRSTALGRPRPSRRLVVAVCLRRPCTVDASATLVTRGGSGTAVRRAIRLPRLVVAADTARSVVLRMSTANRATVRRARSATVALVVRSGGKRLARTYRFRVG